MSQIRGEITENFALVMNLCFLRYVCMLAVPIACLRCISKASNTANSTCNTLRISFVQRENSAKIEYLAFLKALFVAL